MLQLLVNSEEGQGRMVISREPKFGQRFPLPFTLFSSLLSSPKGPPRGWLEE